MDQAQVLESCRKSQALLEGHFLLSSGRHSDRYFQCALLLADPRRASELAREIAARIPERPDVVVGPALGAVVWAHEVARAVGTPSYFTERADGRMELRRGFKLEPGARVLVVEDVTTTGGSVREVLEVVRRCGARPIGVAAIVNRSGVANPFEADNLPFWSLAEVEALSWTAAECPLCKSGERGPAVKPGSRPGAAAGKG
jgi:orotate phosphoribosyltransferase